MHTDYRNLTIFENKNESKPEKIDSDSGQNILKVFGSAE